MPRLLPATEHRAWAGAHAPGALLPRASWTTGAWAPSSRGLFGMSRQLAGPDIKVVGPPRPVSVRSGTRPGSPRPSQRARRASQASPLCGGNSSVMTISAWEFCWMVLAASVGVGDAGTHTWLAHMLQTWRVKTRMRYLTKCGGGVILLTT